MRRSAVDDNSKDDQSTPTCVLLNDAKPTRVQKIMQYQHYARPKIYVEEAQRVWRLEGLRMR